MSGAEEMMTLAPPGAANGSPGRLTGEPATAVGAAGPAITVEGVSKAYGSGLLALDRLSLRVGAGELCCLVGASGCGKSTLLNLAAGLDRPDTGTVSVTGRVALMFQDSALFPWLTVRGNVELALRLAGVARRERHGRASELLRMVRLKGMGGKRPHELSGGMRQRAALARALAQSPTDAGATGRAPAVLLMDEPFAALDAITRDVLHDELERLWSETGLTILFVTHNVREAVRLGDRVLVLSSRPGRVAAEFPVTIPRPRRLDSPAVATLSSVITDRLRLVIGEHAGASGRSGSRPHPGRTGRPVQGPGEVAGHD